PVEREGLTSFGSNAAIALEAVSTNGQWVAYCQPSGPDSESPEGMPLNARGQPERPFDLHVGTARGRSLIDQLLAGAPTGRFIVVRQTGRTLLWDTTTGQRHELDHLHPDLAQDGLPDHRSFAFNESGTEMVMLTDGGGKNQGA